MCLGRWEMSQCPSVCQQVLQQCWLGGCSTALLSAGAVSWAEPEIMGLSCKSHSRAEFPWDTQR